MAIKTFTTGEVLTASDTNTYLANSGLVFVKSQTIGTAVSTVTVTSAFSADYDNYLILASIDSNTGSPAQVNMTLGATATGYYEVGIYMAYNSTTVTGVNSSNLARWGDVLRPSGSANETYASITLTNPFASRRTGIMRQTASTATATSAPVVMNGFLDNTTSYTAFTLVTNTGTITGGTITIYGYRKQ
jgi:hypothetical protein